ncbi:MAG: C25 family cysteine peptidase [Acidobacteriota bacterium]|nr:C25 family cysteine peptidase [Acidobacteriota bacterium]
MVRRLFVATVCALAVFALPLHAGSTGPFTPGATTGNLHMPQGEDAGTANGDFLSDNDAIAITGPYRYFIEVPPGQSKLQVDLYDADIGMSAGEAILNRDRPRSGYNSTVVYRLFNPAGTAVTPRFTTGNNAGPVGSDGDWMVFYSATGNDVADTFATNVYTRNDGSSNWTGDWTETDGGGGGATGGSIRVITGELRLQDIHSGTQSIYREADLLGTPGLNMGMAFLTYDYRTSGNLEAADQITVEISANGGGAWTTLVTYSDDVTGSASFDITPYIANNTRIRFTVAPGEFDQNSDTEFFYVDNVEISDGPAITAGHWELQVDMTTAGGDDINAVGIRAHDGDNTSGGTEFNVYADSMVSMGVNPDGSGGNSKSTTLYPWIVAGCACQHSDFDRDSDGGDVGTQRYTSRLGTYQQTFTSGNLSVDDEWMPNAADNFTSFTNFTSAQLSIDYGIWELLSTINTYINSSGNYETAYLGNYLVPATPPTMNPITSGGFPATFRLYLPNDNNQPPVKPYLAQYLTAFNGPQPSPAIGVAQTYTVSVTVVNPTPHAINFSATNLVISNVPGSGTVYAGSPTVSQGGAPTTPAMGGTGNVSWNPGTVAAGGTATMAYNVTITPAVATTNATATPASGNGTRATYVDETGNTTQARATYRLGGLCELRVVVGALTEAVLSSFEADRGRVSWTAASEAGTIGYNLYRQDGTKVNDSLIVAGRQKYEIDDRSMAESYTVEEITANGRVNRHGPLTMHHRLGPDVQKTNERPVRLRASAEAVAEIATDAAKTVAVMVNVRETGIVRVPFSELVTRFGKPLANIASSAEKGSLSIKTGGQTVAYTSTSDAVLFFGEKSNSIYSNDRVYRIDLSKGERMASVAVAASNESLSSFNGHVDVETDAFAAAVLPLDPESDYWFWDYIVSGDATAGRKTFAFTAPDVALTSGATLEVRLQGALAGASHTARVKLNGVPVGEMTWSSLDARTSTLTLPAGVIRDGANEVEIEGVLAPAAPFDVFYIDGFKISYKRYARPVAGSLEATINAAMTAGPFTSAPSVLDVTNRLRPKVLTGGSFNAGLLGVALPAATKTVFASQQFVVPASYRAVLESTRLTRTDYIVIAPSSLRSGAEALASLRQKEGLRTAVVDLQQIYDDFSNGNTTPHAIRSFIASALQQSPRPRYVVLAGTGTLDYRGIQQAPGPVPPMMVKTNDGLFASDVKIADGNNDGISDLAIGRIPVSTNAELLAYVDKLRNHTTARVDDPIIFAADAVDGGGTSFGQASDEATQPVNTRPRQRFHIDEIGAQATRDGLIAAWTSGSPLINWVGHGGFDQLSGAGVLTAGDSPSLLASGRLPVLVAMTCTINRFEIGGIAEPLGTTLTRQAGGGALAVWSATGLSNHENARELQRKFIQLAASKPQLRLGEVIVQTLAAHPSDTAGIYVLLGDPAIALELPKEIVNGGTPTPSGE